MSLISVSDLTFAYEGSYDTIFEHVSFQIDTDWRLGFTGRNGRGKTTFLKLLMGEHPYQGSIQSSVRFVYFPMSPGSMELTALAAAEAVSGAPEWMLRRELNLMELPPDALERPFSTLSPGERTKALLAALFCVEAGFPLIDEPTNHLDLPARRLVARYLAGKSGFILVSHDRAFLDASVDHILSINRGDIQVQKGNFSSWQENRRRQDAFEESENEKLTKQMEVLRAASQRAASWSEQIERAKIGDHAADRGYIGAQSARMMKRSKAIDKRRESAAKEKEKLLKNVERNETLRVQPLLHHAPVLAEARDLVIRYGGRDVSRAPDFVLRQGERLALTGKNGAGKSSVIKLLAGEPLEHKGLLRRASGLKISYLPQDTSFLSGSVMDYADQCGADRTLFLTILRKLSFPRAQFEKSMADYSAGQKKKVLIAASLCQRAHLYIWDEPLNYVDVLSRIQIEDLILSGRPTMLLVEHDAAFLSRVATRTLELTRL